MKKITVTKVQAIKLTSMADLVNAMNKLKGYAGNA
jgi:hypothetical protein